MAKSVRMSFNFSQLEQAFKGALEVPNTVLARFGYVVNTGALTEVTVTPEPNSGVLWVLGAGLMFVMRKRIGQRLLQAS
jgi:hypothetical protein